jgi:HAD superfamily hydrolase (TIGR01509 family)
MKRFFYEKFNITSQFDHELLVINKKVATYGGYMANVSSLMIPKTGWDAVIFDCDGTLVHTMPAHFEAWCEALSKHGAPNIFPEDVFYAMGGTPTKDIVRGLNAEYNLHLDPEMVSLTKREAYLRKLSSVELIEEVANFAQSMRGKFPLAIATGGSRSVIEKTLKHVGISDWFDEVVTADDVKIGKPSPDIYLETAQRLGIHPSRCLAFEDAPAGIESARAAGMIVVEVPLPTRL